MPSLAAKPNPAKGWLTVYYVYILVATAACLMEVIGLRPWGGYGLGSRNLAAVPFLMALFKFGVYAFAANSLKRLDTGWVVKFHIVLNAVSAVVAGLMVIAYSTSLSIPTLIPWPLIIYFDHLYIYPVLPSIWTIYWVVSKRVKTAYPATGTSGMGPLWIRVPGLTGALDKWSTRAWVQAMAIVAVSTLVPWIINSWTWLRMALTNPYGERWPLIYFAYPLVLLVVSVAAYQLIARKQFRWARIVAATPFVFFIWSGSDLLQKNVSMMYSDRTYTAHLANMEREREARRRAENPEGPFTELYDNGQKRREGNYDGDGLPDGLVTTWYRSGQKESEIVYAGEKAPDRKIYWYENGQKAEESTGDIRLAWLENGQSLTEVTLVDGRPHDGFVGEIGRGGGRTETRYVDGVSVGGTAWYPNGQKAFEDSGRLMDQPGVRENQKSWYENGQKRSEICWEWPPYGNRTKYELTWDETGTQTSPPYDGDLACP